VGGSSRAHAGCTIGFTALPPLLLTRHKASLRRKKKRTNAYALAWSSSTKIEAADDGVLTIDPPDFCTESHVEKQQQK
jgi:hypothetical protein